MSGPPPPASSSGASPSSSRPPLGTHAHARINSALPGGSVRGHVRPPASSIDAARGPSGGDDDDDEAGKASYPMSDESASPAVFASAGGDSPAFQPLTTAPATQPAGAAPSAAATAATSSAPSGMLVQQGAPAAAATAASSSSSSSAAARGERSTSFREASSSAGGKRPERLISPAPEADDSAVDAAATPTAAGAASGAPRRPKPLAHMPSSPQPPPSPSQGPSSASSHHHSSNAALNKRRSQVAQFIRSGESNLVFREKAPSIVPNETGVFYAPPSAMSAARAAALERERQAELSTSFSSLSERAGFMPIPLAGLGANRSDSGSSSPIVGSNSPRRYSAMSSSPMGMSSRQLMFQLTSSNAIGSGTSVTAQNQFGRHRRSSSGVGGASPFPGPHFDRSGRARSDSRGSDESGGSTPKVQTKRFSIFSSSKDEKPSSGYRASSASPARTKSPLTRPLLGTPGLTSSPRHRPASACAPASSMRRRGGAEFGGAGSADAALDAEEQRRRVEEREANLLAPFLEARGNEDFVTYDLTRQQDYHKVRKEMMKEKFERWTREYHKGDAKKSSRHGRKEEEVEMENGDAAAGHGVAAGKADEDDEAASLRAANKQPRKADDLPSDDSDDDDEDDDDGDDPSGGSSCRRCARRFCSNFLIRAVVRAFMLGQSWIICGMIGAVTGLLAAVVDLAVQWLIDLKSGYCSDALHLSNSFCCAGSPQWNGGPEAQPMLLLCPQWINWDTNGSIENGLSSVISPFFAAYCMYVLLGLGMACLSAWLVLYYAPHAAGSGIPEIKTILGGVVVKKYLGAWTLLIKCMALCLSVGSGLSIGKEGGFVHISCCVANILCRCFPEFKNNQYKKNEAISAAAAAGISVAFGAPVGGVLFSLEEVASFFPHKTMWRAFFCAIIASIVFQSIDPYQEGRLVLFQIAYNKAWYWFEMVPFALLGVLGGLLGALFIKLNTRIAEFRKESFIQNHPILEAGAVVLVTVIIRYLSAFLRGNNNAVLASLFGDCKSAPFYDPLSMCDQDSTAEIVGSLLFTAFATFMFTSFTWSLTVPGGVFIPTLIIGASLGRVVGTLMRSWQASSYAMALFDGCDEFTPGIYALVGAASMLGGVTRMTVCLVVIMFELTGGLAYLLPIMVALMFSKLVGDAFDRRSIFEAHLVLNKYPFLNSKDRIPPKIRVADAMSRDLLALPMHGHTVESLTDQLALLGELRITGFPIVTTLKDRFIVGYINRSELYTALCLALRNPSITPQTRCYFAMLSLRFPKNEPYVDLRPWLHPSSIQVVEHTPLYRVHDMFKKMGNRYCLVTNFGKLTGILTKKDILKAIDDQQALEKQAKKKKLTLPPGTAPPSGGLGTVNDHQRAAPQIPTSRLDYAPM